MYSILAIKIIRKFSIFVTAYTVTSLGQAIAGATASLDRADVDICNSALNLTKTDWVDSSTSYSAYVIEAQRRNLSLNDCRRILGLSEKSNSKQFTSVNLDRPDLDICNSALNLTKSNWVDTLSSYAAYVAEAQTRNLSVNDCRRILGLSGTPNANQAFVTNLNRPDLDICNSALDLTKSDWVDQSTSYAIYVNEARERNLTIEKCRAILGFSTLIEKVQDAPQTKAAQDLNEPILANQPAIALPKSSLRKVALVIGNSLYRFATPLDNPNNDAKAMTEMLKHLGFDVVYGADLDKRSFEQKISEFIDKSAMADISLFFYAGHGIQVAGENFLVPIDAKVEKPSAINFELINVNVVTNYMGGDKSIGIILLDACRDNPFTRTLSRALGNRSTQVGSGLAELRSDGGGLLVGFATAPGDVANDGTGMKNSPFTTALLKHLSTKGLEIELLMKRVKADVYNMTKGKQQPWHNSALRTEVYVAGP